MRHSGALSGHFALQQCDRRVFSLLYAPFCRACPQGFHPVQQVSPHPVGRLSLIHGENLSQFPSIDVVSFQ
jgi:hypothetical protein